MDLLLDVFRSFQSLSDGFPSIPFMLLSPDTTHQGLLVPSPTSWSSCTGWWSGRGRPSPGRWGRSPPLRGLRSNPRPPPRAIPGKTEGLQFRRYIFKWLRVHTEIRQKINVPESPHRSYPHATPYRNAEGVPLNEMSPLSKDSRNRRLL